jgi:16S rRNA (guanine966-N2)-methyltransferase
VARDNRKKPARAANTLRIIGGTHRGRKLHFADVPGLRPTPDRVRESVFNWLAPLMPGARCLDLFAGSGALGFEALSRGAREVVFVDSHALAVKSLRENIALLGAGSVEVVQADALDWLGRGSAEPFDIVFLDPPFRQNLLAPCCQRLDADGWLARPAAIYLERESRLEDGAEPPSLPAGWVIEKAKTAGQVTYALAMRDLK